MCAVSNLAGENSFEPRVLVDREQDPALQQGREQCQDNCVDQTGLMIGLSLHSLRYPAPIT